MALDNFEKKGSIHVVETDGQKYERDYSELNMEFRRYQGEDYMHMVDIRVGGVTRTVRAADLIEVVDKIAR